MHGVHFSTAQGIGIACKATSGTLDLSRAKVIRAQQGSVLDHWKNAIVTHMDLTRAIVYGTDSVPQS